MSSSDPRFDRFMKNVPVMPDVAARVMAIADERLDISFRDLESIIKLDPALATKVLKIANSALYARQREITSIQMAITLLGFKNIKSLVMLVVASNMLARLQNSTFYRRFWRRAVHVAFISRNLCRRLAMKEEAETAFLGALLHDIGQMALYSTAADRYNELLAAVESGRGTFVALEEQEFGINHRDLGAGVFEAWNFPAAFVDIAREHGSRNIISRHKQIILVVTVSDLLATVLGVGFTPPNEAELREFARLSGVKDEDIDYFRTNYLTDIQDDPLFQQCRGLYGFD